MGMKRLSRYGIIDDYTLEELRRKYSAADVKGRIALLSAFWKAQHNFGPYPPNLPFEVALAAVEDPNAEIRQWVARFAKYLNFDPFETKLNSIEELDGADGWPKPGERELTGKLRRDSDTFVRACLHENPNVVGSGSHWVTAFHSATHLERLALMRNPVAASHFNRPVIENLFDPEDVTLAIETTQRKQLVLAYISNPEAPRRSRLAEDYHRYVFGKLALDEFWHADAEHNWEEDCQHLSRLWKLAQKWPHPVPLLVFYYIGAEDKTRAETLQQCSDATLRSAILESCVGRLHPQTIALGSKSSDADASSGPLMSLARNSSLTPDQLKELEASIRGIPESAGKEFLLQELRSRIARQESRKRGSLTTWSPPVSAFFYLTIATLASACIAVFWPSLIGLGTETWLLLALLSGLVLNACVMWQSAALARKLSRTLLRK
jgi:hypothetical protein